MQALYRNRLIRAYLGASRYSRDPDGFTGFDQHDNLQMYELQPGAALADQLHRLPRVRRRSSTANFTKPDSVEQTIWNALDKTDARLARRQDATRQRRAEERDDAEPQPHPDAARISAAASRASRPRRACAATAPRCRTTFGRCSRRAAARAAARHQHRAQSHLRRKTGVAAAQGGVVHRLAAALRQLLRRLPRLAASTAARTASPSAPRSPSPAPRPARIRATTRRRPWPSSSPSSTSASARGSAIPAWPDATPTTSAHPRTNLEPLAWELTGTTNDQCPLRLPLRRRPLREPRHLRDGPAPLPLHRASATAAAIRSSSFEDLGNAIRKIRTDLGVPIDIEYDDMHPRSGDSHAAQGPLRHHRAHPLQRHRRHRTPRTAGWSTSSPASTTATTSRKDVYNYATESLDFPHESTADQFFSESQFESYRALGRHAFNEICDGKPQSFANVGAFADHVASRPPLRTKDDVTRADAAGSSGSSRRFAG